MQFEPVAGHDRRNAVEINRPVSLSEYIAGDRNVQRSLFVRYRSDSMPKTVLGYDQCPADEAGASWVTIAGMAYT